MHKVWRALGLMQQRVDQLSIMRHESDMRRAIVVTGKYGMASLMLALKEAEIKSEAIPVHMHQGHTETQHLKDKDETPPTVMVHVEQINETTSPFIPTEEECR